MFDRALVQMFSLRKRAACVVRLLMTMVVKPSD